MANSLDPDQTAPIGAVCSGSTLFASILNSSVMLGNYLHYTFRVQGLALFLPWFPDNKLLLEVRLVFDDQRIVMITSHPSTPASVG